MGSVSKAKGGQPHVGDSFRVRPEETKVMTKKEIKSRNKLQEALQELVRNKSDKYSIKKLFKDAARFARDPICYIISDDVCSKK
ncbi:MAG: hypothetical protein ACXAB4_13425 [Candidatus Hodarchaeales archaeon]|jgi:hypothetical protein